MSTAKTSAPESATRSTTARKMPSGKTQGILRSLGIIGYERVEPVVLAALATQTPLLLIGSHGTAKSLLLTRLAQALGLVWRHYNASLVNYDDLIGYPLPDASGELKFVQTPASIWGAEAVFIDELSRARADMLNRLFPIIHERVVQGMPLERLRHRWAAMNPPAIQSDDGPVAADPTGGNYIGSEPLDPALADRFGFIIKVPAWAELSRDDQDAIIASTDSPVSEGAVKEVRNAIASIEREIPLVLEYAGGAITEAVRELLAGAATLGVPQSGRRAAMIYRNIAGVHAARVMAQPAADIIESSWIALSASIPQRAQGIPIDESRLMVAHVAAWKTARLDACDPRRILACERDPTRRAIRAAVMPQLSKQERGAYVADALAHLPPGGRHALGHWLMEEGHAAGLITAVAAQCGELYSVVAGRQDVSQNVRVDSNEHKAWNRLLEVLQQQHGDADESLVHNLLPGLFTAGLIRVPADPDAVVASWHSVRALLRSVRATPQGQPSIEGTR